MTTPPPALRDVLGQLVTSQPWYRRNANTVTAAWTGLLMVGWFVIDSSAGAPSWVTYAVGGLLYVGQVLGVSKTPNGITPAVVDKVTVAVETSYGRHAR